MDQESSTYRQSNVIPIKAIDRLFQRFSLNYGRQFLDMWRDIPIEEVKDEWADGLSAFNFKDIGAGLDYCLSNSKFPPTLPEFKTICSNLRRPDPVKAITRKFSEEEMAENRQKVAKAAQGLNHNTDYRAWAKRIIANPSMFPSSSLVSAQNAMVAPV